MVQVVTIDPEHRMIGLHMYDGLFKVPIRSLRARGGVYAICRREARMDPAALAREVLILQQRLHLGDTRLAAQQLVLLRPARPCAPQVIPALPGGSLKHEAFNVRMEELSILDVCFLYSTLILVLVVGSGAPALLDWRFTLPSTHACPASRRHAEAHSRDSP